MEARHSYKDLRSASVAQKRFKKRQWKYYDFHGVSEGQLGELHYQAEGTYPWLHSLGTAFPADLSECKVVKLGKRELYDEARQAAPWYKYRHKKPCPDKKYKYHQKQVAFRRTQGYKEAQEWSSKARDADLGWLMQEDGVLRNATDRMCESCFVNMGPDLGRQDHVWVDSDDEDLAPDVDSSEEQSEEEESGEDEDQPLDWVTIDSAAWFSPDAAWAQDDEMSCDDLSDFELL